MKRVIMVLSICIISLIAFNGCTSEPVADIPIYATVKITAANQQIILQESCRLPSDATAADAIEVACRKEKITYQDKNGLYDNFNGISSGKEEGWLFYFNGELAEQGVRKTNLARDEENLVEMRYVNFSEAFSQ